MTLTMSKMIAPYIDPETGMVAARDGGRDNLILNTATLLQSLPLYSDWNDWRAKALKFLEACEVSYGVYQKYPGNFTQNSVDNAIGAACISSSVALKIYLRGASSFWFFPMPGTFSIHDWYGRFIGFPPFIRAAASVAPRLFDPLRLRVAFWFVTRSEYGNTSDKCLSVLQMRVLLMRGQPTEQWKHKIYVAWQRRMQAKYPGGLRELYGIYFGLAHPFTMNAREDFSL